eukprot:scaffold19011_cov100-Skeletonema_marinoi.AAC.3
MLQDHFHSLARYSALVVFGSHCDNVVEDWDWGQRPKEGSSSNIIIARHDRCGCGFVSVHYYCDVNWIVNSATTDVD